MFKLNNKGQSLVMFIILIPIFVLFMTLIFDVGNAVYEKNRIANTNYMVVSYGLDNIETVNENDLIEFVMKNSHNLSNIVVLIENDKVYIKLSKDVKGIIGKMFGFDLVSVISEYEGQIIDGEKRIERIK